jgi:hypothetical protein
MNSKYSKIAAGTALVGTLAVLALFNININYSSSPSSSFLAAGDNGEQLRSFQDFLSTHNKNYLTKDEFNARYALF